MEDQPTFQRDFDYDLEEGIPDSDEPKINEGKQEVEENPKLTGIEFLNYDFCYSFLIDTEISREEKSKFYYDLKTKGFMIPQTDEERDKLESIKTIFFREKEKEKALHNKNDFDEQGDGGDGGVVVTEGEMKAQIIDPNKIMATLVQKERARIRREEKSEEKKKKEEEEKKKANANRKYNLGVDYIPEEGQKWRIANQRILLTYKIKIDKNGYEQWWKQQKYIGTGKIIIVNYDEFNFKMEWMESITYILVDFGKNYQTTNQAIFDYCDIRPTIKKIKDIRQLNTEFKPFLSSKDPKNNDLKTTLVEEIQSQSNINEALNKFVTKPSDATGIIQIYNQKSMENGIDTEEEEEVDVGENPRPWQKETMVEIENRKGARKIICVIDIPGQTGKTELKRYLRRTNPKDYYFADQVGTSRDFGTLYVEACESGWSGFCLVIDIPKAFKGKKKYEDLFQSIESAANGTVTAIKWHTRSIISKKTNIIIFTNRIPPLDVLSRDKWDFRTINMKTFEMIKLETDDVERMKLDLEIIERAKEEARKQYMMESLATKQIEYLNMLRQRISIDDPPVPKTQVPQQIPQSPISDTIKSIELEIDWI